MEISYSSWPWHRSDATALAGYANMMMMMMIGVKVNGIMGYLTISTNVRCYCRIVYNNVVFQQDSALVHLAFNTVQLLQCKTLNFLSPELWHQDNPELNYTDYEIERVI